MSVIDFDILQRLKKLNGENKNNSDPKTLDELDFSVSSSTSDSLAITDIVARVYLYYTLIFDRSTDVYANNSVILTGTMPVIILRKCFDFFMY